jgi:hypothetical protein
MISMKTKRLKMSPVAENPSMAAESSRKRV